MTKEQQIKYIEDNGIVAVVRLDSADLLVQIAQAIREGGVKVIEFTMTTPGALDMIKEAARTMPSDVLLGAGTVLDPETARAVILAGAQFVVAPNLNPKVIEVCHRYSKACIPGSFTPTEVLTAWECGADIVKIFPATLGGPQYFRDLHGPYPQIKMLPTGGVSLENAADFIKAGAVAVAVGSNLVNTKMLKEKGAAAVAELASKYVEVVQKARAK